MFLNVLDIIEEFYLKSLLKLFLLMLLFNLSKSIIGEFIY